MRPNQRLAFTLMELLVVVAIIGVLIGMLMPAVQRVREAAHRAMCASNLHQIWLAVEMYREANGKFPDARNPYGWDPIEWSDDDDSTDPENPLSKRISKLLGPYCEESRKVFLCPSDSLQNYGAKYGLSYEYKDSFFRSLSDKTWQEVTSRRESHSISVLWDAYWFHGPQFSGRGRNVLYLDGHVN